MTSGFIDLARRRSKEPKNRDLITGKEHFSHYTFDVDHRGVDMNGFILHTDKHKGKREKLRI